MKKYRIVLWAVLICAILTGLWFVTPSSFSGRPEGRAPGDTYEVVVSEAKLSCIHPVRPSESILWKDVTEIRVVKTADGLMNLERWLTFVGDKESCTVPGKAKNFTKLWDMIPMRFTGFVGRAYSDSANPNVTIILWKKDRTSAFSESRSRAIAEAGGSVRNETR